MRGKEFLDFWTGVWRGGGYKTFFDRWKSWLPDWFSHGFCPFPMQNSAVMSNLAIHEPPYHRIDSVTGKHLYRFKKATIVLYKIYVFISLKFLVDTYNFWFPWNYMKVTTLFLTAPAVVQYFTGVRSGVTGVQLRSPGCTGMTMISVGVHPSKPEMQNLVGVKISALKSDWGARKAHEKFHRGRHKWSIFHWSLGSIASGLHHFPINFSGVHPGAPPLGQWGRMYWCLT